MEEKGLKHRVLLKGGEVSTEKYAVQGVPTTFLIDREGRILSRDVGFSPASSPSREAAIEALLVAGTKPADGASRGQPK